MKKGCAPAKLDEPPYTCCFLCWQARQKRCVLPSPATPGPAPAPVRRTSRRFQPPESAPAPVPEPAPAPPSFLSGPKVDSPLFTALPTAIPLHGSVGAPLPDLIGWNAAIFSARDECRSARAAHAAAEAAHRAAVLQLEISASCISFADERLIEAWRNYYFLVEGVVWDGYEPAPTFPASSPDRDEGEPAVASSSDPKGKGKAQSPPSEAEEDDGAASDDDLGGGGDSPNREMECA
jgi:hypothetical protein